MNVNQVAFCTVTALGLATAGSAIMAATTAATVATVAYSILTVVLGGASIASITAWVKTNTDQGSVSDYFTAMKDHAGVAIAGLSQFVAQIFVQSVIQGVADGISKKITRKIAGPDVIVQHT